METVTNGKFKEKVEKRKDNYCVFESSVLEYVDATPSIFGQDRPLLGFEHCHLSHCTFDSMKVTHFDFCDLNHVTFRNCSFGIEHRLFDLCVLDEVYFDSCTFSFNDIFLSHLYSARFHKCIFEAETRFKSSIILHSRFTACENTNVLNFEHCSMGPIFIDGKMQRFITIDGIGSRKGITTYNITQDNVRCGCWNTNGHNRGGSLDEFEKRVNETYPPNNSDKKDNFYRKFYRKEYVKAIELFKTERKRHEHDIV